MCRPVIWISEHSNKINVQQIEIFANMDDNFQRQNINGTYCVA